MTLHVIHGDLDDDDREQRLEAFGVISAHFDACPTCGPLRAALIRATAEDNQQAIAHFLDRLCPAQRERVVAMQD